MEQNQNDAEKMGIKKVALDAAIKINPVGLNTSGSGLQSTGSGVEKIIQDAEKIYSYLTK